MTSVTDICLHPVDFFRNLIRTMSIMMHWYKTVEISREDNLTFKMRKPLDPEGPFFPKIPLLRYPGFNPHTRVLPKGHKRNHYNKELPCEIILEKDVTIPMRDGIKLYCDIYRPNTKTSALEDEKVPIILAYAPYGKEGNSELFLNELPERLGVRKEDYSGYENFEAPDPAFWCDRGYAIVNIDARGSWNSEGNMFFWGDNACIDARDGYDAVEFLAKLPWCNGRVGMSGNSWLAISQWFIASSQPPSLAAIAPWEGASDMYRDQARRGGAPEPIMSHSVGLLCPGRGLQEDHALMTLENEMFNTYWEDKRAKLSKITCPTYVVSSYTSKLHIQGSYRGFREVNTKHKWLRVHNEFEWVDWLHYQDDLASFFDCFLKGVHNSWKQTPSVRLSLLRFSDSQQDIVDAPFPSYPPPNMMLQTFYLDASSKLLSSQACSSASTASYLASDMKSEIYFDLMFEKYTELAGYPKLKLWMSCTEHDDMDVYVLIGKIDKNKEPLLHANFKPTVIPREKLPKTNVVQYQGPTGFLRASHRDWAPAGPSYAEPQPLGDDAVSLGESSGQWDGRRELWHPHVTKRPVQKGEVVELEFTTWPIGVVYEAGEGLRLRVSGRDMCFIEDKILPVNKTQNIGTHFVHTGGKYGSSIDLPVLSI